MSEIYPYQVYNPAGTLVLQAPVNCRYPRTRERQLLDAGYTIRLEGKKILKRDVKEEK